MGSGRWKRAGSKGKFSASSNEKCSPSCVVTAAFHSRESMAKLGHHPVEHKLYWPHLQSSFKKQRSLPNRVLKVLTSSLSRGICPYPANASNLLKNLPHFSKIFIPIAQVEMLPLLGLIQLLQVKVKSKSALQLLRRDPAAASPLHSVMPSAATFCCSPLFQVLSNSLGAPGQQTRCAVGSMLHILLRDTSF